MTRAVTLALAVAAAIMPLLGADFEGPVQGTVVAGPAVVSLSQATGGVGVTAMPPPVPMPDQTLVRALKAQAPAVAPTANALIQLPPPSNAGGVPVLSRLEGLDQTEFGTPDPAIAAGLSEVVEVINSTWAVFDKSGAKLAAGSLRDLFRPVNPPAAIYQPQVFFDMKEQRWVITALALNPAVTGHQTVESYWLIAASLAPSAMGSWYVWKTDASSGGVMSAAGIAADQALGYNSVFVVLTANLYSPNDPAYQYARVRVLDKRELYEGRLRSFADFWGLKDENGRPASSVRPMRAPAGAADFYLADVAPDSGSHVTVWQVHATATTPALERLPAAKIRYFQAPPDAAQPGTDIRLATGPARLQSLEYANGRLYCTFNEAYRWTGDGVAAIRYLVLENTAGSMPQPGFATRLDKTLGNGLVSYFNPSVAVDGRGNAYFAFNVSSPNIYPGMGYAGWHEGETLSAPAILRPGLASYGTSDPAPFGRVTSIALDPNADNVSWIAGEYCREVQNWGTAMGILSFDPLRYRATVLADDVPAEVKSDTLLKFGQTRPHWNAVGIRSGGNWQLDLWDANFLTLRARSADDRPGPQTDFCVSDGNHSPLDTMGVKLRDFDSTTATVEFTQATSGTTLDAERVNGPYQWNDNDVIRVCEYHATPATDTCFTLSVAGGNVNLGMAIFRSPDAPYYVDRSQAVAVADVNGPGEGEYIHFHALVDDYYAIVTWADNKATGQYALSTACQVNLQPNPIAHPDAFHLEVGGSGVMSDVTSVSYDIPKKTSLAIRVYDAEGRAVRTLVAHDAEPGHYTVGWDGRSATGRTLAAGTYFVRFESKEFTADQKLVKIQ